MHLPGSALAQSVLSHSRLGEALRPSGRSGRNMERLRLREVIRAVVCELVGGGGQAVQQLLR